MPAIRAEITPRTRLLGLSHVSWINGALMPLRELAGHGVPILVDGAQGAGAIPVDVEELGVDFYTVSAQKWLLGPAATGALYVARSRLDDCRVAFPSYFSWKLPDYELRDGAVRFEGSWTPPASVAGLLASFAFAAEVGEERFSRAREAAERCRALLLEHGAEVVTEPGQGTLVSWRADDPESMVDRLAEQGVSCATSRAPASSERPAATGRVRTTSNGSFGGFSSVRGRPKPSACRDLCRG